MSLKTAFASLAAAALIVGSAVIPAGATGAGGPHGGGGPSFLAFPPWVGPGPTCEWVQVKYYSHKHVYWRSVQRCQ